MGTRIPVVILSGQAGRLLADRDGARVRVAVRAVSQRRRTHNVLAETVDGKGQQVVMAGGHLDSVPAGPGINDNGSGVAALLHIADRLHGRAPCARVRLAFWDAEELGLIGADLRRVPAGARATPAPPRLRHRDRPGPPGAGANGGRGRRGGDRAGARSGEVEDEPEHRVQRE